MKKSPLFVRMNAVFHYIKTLAIVHKSRCYNHLTNMKPKCEHNDNDDDNDSDDVDDEQEGSKQRNEKKSTKRTDKSNKTKPEKLKQ